MTTLDLPPTGFPDWLSTWPEAERAIHRSVRGRLPAGVEPEDVSQQVAVDLIRAGESAPPADRLRYWSVAVARRVVADMYRKKTIPVHDLAESPVVDVEAVALTRLRCEVAAKAYADLAPADRRALAEADGEHAPVPNSTKLRRSRARQTLRQKAERLVGGGLLLPRWSWLAGAAGTAAAVIPLCVGLTGSGVESPEDRRYSGSPSSGAPAGVTPANSLSTPTGPPTTVTVPRASSTRPAAPEAPTYHRRVVVSVPGAEPIGYDHYSPAPSSETPPAACARNLKLADGVCVEHPLS